MNNREVATILHETGLLMELQGENSFKIRAYYNGARTMEALEEDLEKVVGEGRLQKLPGIGPALTEKITELVETGRMAYHEELKTIIPEGVLELLQIPGLGPKKAGTLYRELGIASIGELEYACRENRLVTLKGFGIKTQQRFLQGIEMQKRFQGKHLLAEARPLALEILDQLAVHPQVIQGKIAGNLRRGHEIIEKIDFLVATEEPEKVIEFFSQRPQVEEIIEQSTDKINVKLDYGLKANLQAVAPEYFPYAVLRHTGSETHYEGLQQRAENMGLTLNDQGLFRNNEALTLNDEKAIYQGLGLSYIPPELREGNGEIEIAAEGKLPQLVETEDIKGIFHIHSNYSDGTDSLEEMVVAAMERGYQYLGFADHSQSAYYAGGLTADDVKRQHDEIDRLQGKYPDIIIFKGIESEIKADGSLDYDEETLASFDFIIASLHGRFNPEMDLTDRLITAISHPRVTMLGHPTGRLLLARDGYQVDMEALLQAAKEYQVIIELNSSPARLDIDWRHLQRAKELGVKISINPDAHRHEDIDDVIYGVIMARKGWLSAEDVFNTLDGEEMRLLLQKRQENI